MVAWSPPKTTMLTPLIPILQPDGIVCTETDIFFTRLEFPSEISYIGRVNPINGSLSRLHNLGTNSVVYPSVGILPNNDLLLSRVMGGNSLVMTWDGTNFTTRQVIPDTVWFDDQASHQDILRHSPDGTYFYLMNSTYIRAFRTVDLSVVWTFTFSEPKHFPGWCIHPITGNIFTSLVEHIGWDTFGYLLEIRQGEIVDGGGTLVRPRIPTSFVSLDTKEVSECVINHSGDTGLFFSPFGEVLVLNLATLEQTMIPRHPEMKMLDDGFTRLPAHGTVSIDNKFSTTTFRGNLVAIDINTRAVNYYPVTETGLSIEGLLLPFIGTGNGKIYYVDQRRNLVKLRYDQLGSFGRITPSNQVGASLPEGYYATGDLTWGPPSQVLSIHVTSRSLLLHTGGFLRKLRIEPLEWGSPRLFLRTSTLIPAFGWKTESPNNANIPLPAELDPYPTVPSTSTLVEFLNLDNEILVINWRDAFVWNMLDNVFTRLPNLINGWQNANEGFVAAITLADGRVQQHLINPRVDSHAIYTPISTANPYNGSWEHLTTGGPLSWDFTELGAVVNNEIYLLSFNNTSNAVTGMRRFNVATATWNTVSVPPLTFPPLSGTTLVSIGNTFSHAGEIYYPALGYKYNVSQNQWHLLPTPMPPEFLANELLRAANITIDPVNNIAYFGVVDVGSKTLAYALPGATIPY